MKSKKKSITLMHKQAMTGYLFLAPVAVGLMFIFIPAVIQAIIYSMNTIKMSAGNVKLEWLGLRNYYHIIMVNPSTSYLITSLRQAAIHVPIIIIFSFFIANVLNQRFVGRGFTRAIFFLPVIMAAGIIGQLDSGDILTGLYNMGGKLDTGIESANIFNYESVKAMLQNSELNQTFINMILGAVDGLYSVVTSSGVQILIFLSGLQSISPSLFEAAYVEGANGWVSFWKISFPMISPLIMVNVIYTMINSFTSSDNAAMQQIRIYLYGNQQYSYAMALSIVYILVVAILISVVYLIVNKFIVYQED